MESYGKKAEMIIRELRGAIMDGTYRSGDRMPSENELAERYGVSRQTVRKGLSVLVREGLIRAEHGRGTFVSERRPNRSRNIAVVTTYLSDYIFPQVIQGIDRVLTENGFSILLKSTHNSRQLEAKFLEELLESDIGGLIIEPSKSQIFCRHVELYETLEARGIPIVFIQGFFRQMADRPSVLMDDCQGGYEATAYLTGLGHSRIVGVFKADDSQGIERHRGYVRALQEAGMKYMPERVIWYHTEDRTIAPAEEIRAYVRREGPPDAVVCYNDEIAIDVIRALEAEGLSVPGDVSVTGYDDSLLAKSLPGGITSVAHPHEELGRIAADLLMKLIRGEETERHVRIQAKLLVRGSCAEKRG